MVTHPPKLSLLHRVVFFFPTPASTPAITPPGANPQSSFLALVESLLGRTYMLVRRLAGRLVAFLKNLGGGRLAESPSLGLASST